jgi:actin related protein 2/3 complex, subunit 3
VDEALSLFKANILFRNFEVNGSGDRLLIYLTLYISKCLAKFAEKKPNKGDAEKLLYQTAIENFSLPGDKDFPLGGLVTPPKDRTETGMLFGFFVGLFQYLVCLFVFCLLV